MTRKNSVKLGVQTLEAREVPTVAALDAGVLRITGTNTGETIIVRQSPTALTVDGVNGSFALGAVSEVFIDARGGNDTIDLQRSGAVVTRNTVIWGGAGDDEIRGGNGVDLIDGGADDDALFGFGGADRLAGDTGADLLRGGDQNDNLAGGAENDILIGDGGTDRFDGGKDSDTYLDVAAGENVHEDFLFNTIVGSGYTHHFNATGGAVNSEFGWYDANMGDSVLRRDARTADRDDTISRTEMIDLLRSAADGTTVTGTEFEDLKRFTAAGQIGMSPAVRNLSTKLVHGDPANQWFTGGAATRVPLGNLTGGTSSTNMHRLIDKWFLGADRPVAQNTERSVNFDYRRAEGELFVGVPNSTDIDQGNVGDCWFLAGLGAVADQAPERIRNLIADNDDGTFTVRFFRDGRPEFVTVDRFLPTNGNQQLVYASDGNLVSSRTNELWVALVEKAYAQLNESRWTGQDGTNSYNGLGGRVAPLPFNLGVPNLDGINEGHSDEAIRQITGAATSVWTPAYTTFTDVVRSFFSEDKAIVFLSTAFPAPGIFRFHDYIMIDFNLTDQTITLRNPHADRAANLVRNWGEIQANFLEIYYGHV